MLSLVLCLVSAIKFPFELFFSILYVLRVKDEKVEITSQIHHVPSNVRSASRCFLGNFSFIPRFPLFCTFVLHLCCCPFVLEIPRCQSVKNNQIRSFLHLTIIYYAVCISANDDATWRGVNSPRLNRDTDFELADRISQIRKHQSIQACSLLSLSLLLTSRADTNSSRGI